MVRRTLARALDWRFRAVVVRLDALTRRVDALAACAEPAVERVDALAASVDEQAARTQRVEQLLEGRMEPMLRAVLDEEARNRRRLFALRDDPRYEAPFADADPLVTVTVATRDRIESLINRALPSLLSQTHRNLEVVVVGDAAPAELSHALAGLGDARVRYANLSQRTVADDDSRRHWLVGSTIPRNEATRMARGLWLLHFDDDDRLHPDAIASLLALARRERAEVAYGGFLVHSPDGTVESAVGFPPTPGRFGWQGALVHAGLSFFQRELVAGKLGIPGDMYLLERMLRVGVRFASLERPVWDYHPSSLR